jgi:predicted MFS family arabinose efflux permease
MRPVTSLEKYSMLAMLFTLPYLPTAFFGTALPAILREQGIPLEQLSLLGLLLLFWAVKFLWAPPIDHYQIVGGGHYRGWCLVMLTLVITGLVGLALIDGPNNLGLLAVGLGSFCLLATTLDNASFGLSLVVLTPEERAIGNGIISGSTMIGIVLGAGLGLVSYTAIGWPTMMLIFALLCLPAWILVWRCQETRVERVKRQVDYGALLSFFRQPGAGAWVVLLLLYNTGSSVGFSLASPMLVDAKWSLEQIGLAANIIGTLAGAVGALLGGKVVQRVGRQTALLAFGSVQVLATLLLLPTALGINNPALVYLAIAAVQLSTGLAASVIFALAMDRSRVQVAATDQALQICLYGLGNTIATILAVFLAGSLGYAIMLGLAALLTLGAIGYAYISANRIFSTHAGSPGTGAALGETDEAQAPNPVA